MIKQVDVDYVSRRLAEDAPPRLLDVRQPWENEYCQLSDSILIPLGELPGRVEELEFPHDAEVIVYCHHGVRSLSGAAILQAAGFTNVASMAGGIEAWSHHIDPTIPRY